VAPDLEPTLVYLAEPIDQAGSAVAAIMAQIVNNLHVWDCNIYRPRTAFDCKKLDPRVDRINRDALYRADVMVAYLSTETPSIGVPAEIEAATSRDIPAVIVYAGKSFALAANPLVEVVDGPHSVTAAIRHAIKTHPRLTSDSIRLVIKDEQQLPRRVYPDDAGVDLTTAVERTIQPGEYLDIHTQVEACELPPGYWGMITGRSSTLRKHKLHVPLAVIDPGWRGPLFIGCWNLGPVPVTVKPGDRLGQLILMHNNPAQVLAVDAVSEHPRGLNGFGSSG